MPRSEGGERRREATAGASHTLAKVVKEEEDRKEKGERKDTTGHRGKESVSIACTDTQSRAGDR